MTWIRLTIHWIVSDCDLGKVRVYTPSKDCVGFREQKIADIGRFFGEKSDFGGLGKDFAVEKSAKNHRFFR